MMNKKKNKRIKKKKRVRHQKANIEKKNLDRIQEVKEEDKIRRTNKKAKKAKERVKKKAKSNNEKKSDFYKEVINGEDLLKETLKYEIPKVVVFNVNSMRYDRNSSEVREAYNRLMIDNMKWSKEKIELINASMTEEESFISYVFPILRYHSRFDELTKEDFEFLFKNKTSTYNGFLINKNVKPVTNLPTKRRLASYEFDEECYDYLQKITDLCKENGIELVLIKAPSIYPYWYDEYDKQIESFAEENDLDFYNFLDSTQEIGIDYQTDTYDGGLHLNLDGATKLSKYFANILMENYDLTDYSGDELYDEKLEEYNNAIK